MKRITLLSLASALIATGVIGFAAQGCGDDDSATTKTDAAVNNPDTAIPTGDSTPGTDSGTIPAVPTLGAQIDRMGRPAINTALNATFEADATKGPKKDAYNADTNLAAWGATYVPEFSKNLAVLDSLDNDCTNQVASNPDSTTNVTHYGALAGLTADDRLYLNTAVTTCTAYLAVESAAVLGVAAAAMDCGGRALSYDVIDITYSAAATAGVTGVKDGIDAVPAKTSGAMFPYLAAPVQ